MVIGSAGERMSISEAAFHGWGSGYRAGVPLLKGGEMRSSPLLLLVPPPSPLLSRVGLGASAAKANTALMLANISCLFLHGVLRSTLIMLYDDPSMPAVL
jgi:hypothetical protein